MGEKVDVELREEVHVAGDGASVGEAPSFMLDINSRMIENWF